MEKQTYIEVYRQHNIYQDQETQDYNTVMDDVGRVIADNLFNMHELIDGNMDGNMDGHNI